jgi:hypothetical protein
MSAITWMHFPQSHLPSKECVSIIDAFKSEFSKFNSKKNKLNSNNVLSVIEPALKAAGFKVEASKKADDKIAVPVLFGRDGKVHKTFNVDAYHPIGKLVLEVEAGRAVVNNQFLKDFFEACMMQDVDYVVIAVRNDYRGNNDFEAVCAFFEALYASQRMILPLKGVTLIGY